MINARITEDSATSKLERMYDKWDSTIIRGANHLAETFAENMREHIRGGDFDVEQKKDTWYSYDDRPLINRGAYVNSIKAVGPGVVCDVQLMQWLEFGTRSQPARPHWGPLLRQFARFQIPSKGDQILYELSRY